MATEKRSKKVTVTTASQPFIRHLPKFNKDKLVCGMNTKRVGGWEGNRASKAAKLNFNLAFKKM